MREGSKIEWSVLWRLNPCGLVDIPDLQRLKNQRHFGSSCMDFEVLPFWAQADEK